MKSVPSGTGGISTRATPRLNNQVAKKCDVQFQCRRTGMDHRLTNRQQRSYLAEQVVTDVA